MAETRFVDIQRRKAAFQSQYELYLYLALGLGVVIALVMNALKVGLFAWQGWLAVGLLTLVAMSIRNYLYVKQLSALEFFKVETYRRAQVMIFISFLGLGLVIALLPRSAVLALLPPTVPFPLNAISYLLLALLAGVAVIAVNLHLPARSRDKELLFEEKENVSRMRRDLEEEWDKFRGESEETLSNLSRPGVPSPLETTTLTAIRVRMDHTVKYLEHVRRNQHIIIQRHHDGAEKNLILSQIAMRFLLLTLFVAAIKIMSVL